MRALILAVILAGCAKKTAEEPPVKPIPAEEVKRGEDACKAYVDQVCACAAKVPAAKDACDAARAMPDALKLQVEFAASDTNKNDVLAAQAGIRKLVKACIEETAKLPGLGCQ